ncbi:MAG: methionyl-tRNA formyltransferase [Myxococcales bacterium]|nr:methionyl-tRNA formyltransferase [Myxococcales bacterium]
MSRPLRVVFMGTPDLAAAVLRALLDGPHPVVGVVSQPDRPAGRGQRVVLGPVSALARERGLPLAQPSSVKTAEFRAWLAALEPDVAVVAAFGHILGPKLLDVPRLGCVNVHASALPRWRGASPIQAAIAAGDAATGVSIMQMDPGLDTGPVFVTRPVPIAADETAETLHDRLAEVGGEAVLAVLDELARGEAVAVPQPDEGATYAHLIRKDAGDLDFGASAVALDRQVRAYHPWPGTRTTLRGQPLKVLPPVTALATRPAGAAPGEIVTVGPDGVDVACGEGALRLRRLQLAGKKALDVADFLRGADLSPGMRLGGGLSDGT